MKAPVLAIAMGKPKGPGMMEEEDDGDEREAFESYADVLGIAKEKRDAAYDSLVAMIQACIAREKSGGYEED